MTYTPTCGSIAQMNVAGPSATACLGSAPRSNALTSTVRSGLATGTFCESRNENISRVVPHVTVPDGLMICGKTDGLWVVTSQPSGVSAGLGVTGHAAAADPEADAGGVAEPPVVPPLPPEHAAARSAITHTTARRIHRVMGRSVAEVAVRGRAQARARIFRRFPSPAPPAPRAQETP